MNIILDVIIGVVVVVILALVIFEYRIRQPDFLVLHESNGRISLRKGLVYPRHFSLALPRTTCPIQLTVDATAAGNLGVRVKLVGSVAPSLENIAGQSPSAAGLHAAGGGFLEGGERGAICRVPSSPGAGGDLLRFG